MDELNEKLDRAIEFMNNALEAVDDALRRSVGAAIKPFLDIDWEAVAREQRKHDRRVAYHRRLSERNRLHPKKKPRR